jgi:hypothetical protein
MGTETVSNRYWYVVTRDRSVTCHVTSAPYSGSRTYASGSEWSGVYIVTCDRSVTCHVTSAPYPWSRTYASGVEWSGVDFGVECTLSRVTGP